MKRTMLLVLVTLGCLLHAASVFAAESDAAQLFNRHCAACHGPKGDGQGPAAYLLSPKPRDFTSGTYKFRSTPSGSPPTDGDLLRTLQRGIPGTSMPMWDRLPEQDQVALVEYVKSFSDIFEDEDAMDPVIEIAAPPAVSEASIRAGQKIYQEMKCADCHGPGGKGDGPSSATLKDDWDHPIRPYDFTRGPGLMKGGASRQDIYRTFVTGLDGTPMPGYEDSMDETERWQLVSYVQSLSSASQGSALPAKTPTLHALKVATDPSIDQHDPIWKQAPATTVPIRPLWARAVWVDAVEVQAIIGPTEIAYRFEWRDPQLDEETIKHRQFRDAVAIQFVSDGSPSDYIGIPFIGMGDEQKTVTILHWKADWEADIAGGFRIAEKQNESAISKMVDGADFAVDKQYLTGLAAGNSLSERSRTSPVETLVAKGFGTLTRLPKADQVVKGRGVWRDGVWTVVMHQPLDSALAPQLQQGQSLPVAVAVWDGAAGDRNGQKAVSQWMGLVVE